MTIVSSEGGASAQPAPGWPAARAFRRWLRPDGAAQAVRRLWYDRPVRWQLLATFVLINVVTGAVAGWIVIHNAHRATAVEVAASMEAAEQVVRSTAEQLSLDAFSHHPPESASLRALESLPVRLRHLRHVRIAIVDAGGRLVAVQPERVGGERDGRNGAPAWFAALFRFDRLSREVPVVLEGRHIGTVLVTNQPADEIAEVWQDVSDLAAVVLIANIVVIVLFSVALGRLLTPLTSLAAGLRELEQGRFGYRLSRPHVRELGAIVDRFNALAGALQAARADNARLNRRLVTVQDEERREIATELHDELGACLFGLRANVLSVQRLADSLPAGVAEPMRKRAQTLVEVSERIQTTNRRLLHRIRPMALGHAALADVIAGLVADFERNDPGHAFRLDIGRLRHGYGDCIDLTVYRCIQEGLTNAMRHAAAKAVTVSLDEMPAAAACTGGAGPAELRLSVADDGCGMAPEAAPGRGLSGMERRVRALGGTFAIAQQPGGGTRLEIAIPLDDAEAGGSAPAHLEGGRP